MPDDTTHPGFPIPYGYCQCGCGQKAPIVSSTDRTRGRIKGEPSRFVSGHNMGVRLLYQVDNASDCWLWTGHIRDNGPRGPVGRKWDGGRNRDAHVVMWEREHGPVPQGHELWHVCGHTICANSKHLVLRSIEEIRSEAFDQQTEVSESGCLLWRGTTHGADGYGVFSYGGQSQVAHRYAWERKHGPIPDGLSVHHRCAVKQCVNPSHLELTTPQNHVLVLTQTSVCAKNKAKTHCVHGHPFDEVNTVYPNRGGRQCRTCNRERKAALRQLDRGEGFVEVASE